MVRRPVADLSKRHYPHANPGGQRAASECEAWTPEEAKRRIQARGERPRYIPPQPAPEVEAQHEAQPAPAPNPVPMPAPVDDAAIRSQVRAEMVSILDEYGVKPPVQVIEVKQGENARKVDGPAHAQVPQLIGLLARGVFVYLFGPAGGGKTHAGCQALEAVTGRATVITMPGITAGKLFGFTDAGGRFVKTAFVDAYTNGGGIVLDEFDRAIPQVASAFNSVLENGRATFNGEEVKMHADFRLIATGNTDMRGGTRTYTGAQPMDLATAARFRFVRWTYDEALESALVCGVIPKAQATKLLTWARKLRDQLATDRHDTVFCGPRETMRMAADLAAGATMEDAAHGWVFRGLDPATVTRLLNACPLPIIDVVQK